jgi:hypothetical protein
MKHDRRAGLWCIAFVAAMAVNAGAQDKPKEPKKTPKDSTTEVYGFVQGDAIFDFDQNNPDWFDVNRPTKLPAFHNEFGGNNHMWFSARQTRFGVKTVLPGGHYDFKAHFEFDMFGVGVDAGKTTIRLRHAWGQWKKIGGGQTNGQFTDTDIFPNSLDYWGPNGMAFFRNVQVFYEPFNDGSSNARIAIEAPGASGDAGVLADRVELQNVKPRFPSPDFTGHYRMGRKWGYVQLGGVVRYIGYDDLLTTDKFDLSGHVWGWGINVSSVLKVTPTDTLRLGVIEGAGVENYFNDAPIDVGIKSNLGNAVTPVVGEALGDFGLSLFLDHNWNSKYSTAVGYSRVDIDNSNGQAPNAYKDGQYALVNLLYAPMSNVMMGGELQWIHRENFSDGFSVSDVRFQFSLKVNFGVKVGG